MSKRLTESQKHNRQYARFWGRQVIRTIGWLESQHKSLAFYQQRDSDPQYAAIVASITESIAIDERRQYDNARRAAHNAGLALDNLWVR